MAMHGSVRTVLTAIGLAAAAMLVPAASPAGGQAAGCAPPYLPIFGFTTAASQADPPRVQVYPETAVVAPSLDGQDLSYDTSGEPDMDGDGQADVVSNAGASITITRGDGVLTLSQTGSSLTSVARFHRADLDADGHDETYLEAVPTGPGEPRFFVVPGTTAVGAHVLADVAIEVPAGIVGLAGDQVDGPGEDLLAQVGGGGGLVSGDAVVAPGPGGSLAAFVAASAPLDPYGQAVGLLLLDDGPPVIALVRPGDGASIITLWDEGETTEFRTAGATGFEADPQVTAIDTPDGLLLVAGAGSRSGGVTFVWDLDDPCATNPPATPTAPAAAPVSGTADYTG